jgi:hypothetical protein
VPFPRNDASDAYVVIRADRDGLSSRRITHLRVSPLSDSPVGSRLKAHSSTQLLPHPRTPIGTPLLCERQVMLLYKSHKFLAERALRSVKKARDRHATCREITKAKRRTPLHSLGANRHGHEKDAQDDNERTILCCTTRRLPAVLVGDASRGYS